MDPGCDLSFTGGGTWDGTVLNSTQNLSNIFLNGTWKVNGDARQLGSNLAIGTSFTASVDWQATNAAVTVYNGAGIGVSQGSTLSFSGDSSTGLVTSVLASNFKTKVDNSGLVQRTGGSPNQELLDMPMTVESTGRLWVQDGNVMEIGGLLYQVGGTTDIGSVGGTKNTYLFLDKGADVFAGNFETLGSLGVVNLATAGTQLTIRGSATLLICAGDNTSYGTLRVDGPGDVNLSGGTFAVWGKVGTGYDQLWDTSSNIIINSAAGGCTLSVHTDGNPGPADDWHILFASLAGKSISGEFASFNWNGGYNWVHKNNTRTYDLTP